MLNSIPVGNRSANEKSISKRCHKTGCSCFPSTATVNLENGRRVKMSELQVGEKVQTGMKSASIPQMKLGYREKNYKRKC